MQLCQKSITNRKVPPCFSVPTEETVSLPATLNNGLTFTYLGIMAGGYEWEASQNNQKVEALNLAFSHDHQELWDLPNDITKA
jgi:hypothetical protein